ncbi:hypothetical protein TUM20985_55540 [Mycobacterium antarcticum]|nr:MULTISPECIES: hypothetical protein [unclassified Mycolicibacterium]BDX35007.1 hypothetical protein TUM20985_55540 [Mycolicibacterium sp. TUM20985]GLP78234.1 hypothetical protein TUM20983_53440 [Mycolicibacterium sp. TUM20983]
MEFKLFYYVIGLASLVPIVNIFVANGTDGAAGTGANGGAADRRP